MSASLINGASPRLTRMALGFNGAQEGRVDDSRVSGVQRHAASLRRPRERRRARRTRVDPVAAASRHGRRSTCIPRPRRFAPPTSDAALQTTAMVLPRARDYGCTKKLKSGDAAQRPSFTRDCRPSRRA